MLPKQVEEELNNKGFIQVGPPVKVRYCYVCKKRLALTRQWLKALALGQPQVCFCRSCAIAHARGE